MTALEAGLEAVLFAAGDAVTIERLSAALEAAPAELLDAAAALENRYDFENRGIMLLRIEDKLQLASRPMYGPYVRRVTESRRPPALSPAALEVLTIIAYRQPVTFFFFVYTFNDYVLLRFNPILLLSTCSNTIKYPVPAPC